MNLRDHRDWDKENGLLSVPLLPDNENLHVLLNGQSGNLTLDYSEEIFNRDLSIQRAWSSDTGFYIKVLSDDKVKVVNWWDGKVLEFSGKEISNNPKLFYKAITEPKTPSSGSIISFAKGAFLKLRSYIQQQDNGQASLRMLMYLLAALNDGVEKPTEVNRKLWKLEEFDTDWIVDNDWSTIYEAFQKGNSIIPLVELVLRHASNRLFQEAHREATQKVFQLAMFGGTEREYDSEITEGAYYTPTPLVRTIVQESLWALNNVKPITKRATLKILDPACGSAEFLREALRQLKLLNYSGKIEVVGWDKSPIACEISRFVLNYENRTVWNGKCSVNIVNRNSLLDLWQDQFDMVLMNPPFIPFENLGEYKSVVLEKLNGFIKRQPDGAAVFWKNASEAVSNNGVIGLILPISFLGAETYDGLRTYIKNDLKFDFSLVGRLGSTGLFEKAMIIPSIQVATKGKNDVNTVLWTNHKEKSAYDAFRDLRIYRQSKIPVPMDMGSYSIYENDILTNSSDNWTVRSYKTFELAGKLKDFITVGDVFSINRGVDTGHNASFIIPKAVWENMIPDKEKKYFHPCLTKGSIDNGKLYDEWYVFYPYGENKIKSEQELENKLKKYYRLRLEPNIKALKKRKGTHEWWELSRPRLEWQLKWLPKLVSSHFGGSGYFAYDKEGKYVLAQGFAWLPKKNLNHKEYFAYLGLLHAPLIDILLEMVSVNVGGGQFSLAKRYVENMPLPDFSKIDTNSFLYLVDTGKNIHQAGIIDRKDLDIVVANLYGLNLSDFKTD